MSTSDQKSAVERIRRALAPKRSVIAGFAAGFVSICGLIIAIPSLSSAENKKEELSIEDIFGVPPPQNGDKNTAERPDITPVEPIASGKKPAPSSADANLLQPLPQQYQPPTAVAKPQTPSASVPPVGAPPQPQDDSASILGDLFDNKNVSQQAPIPEPAPMPKAASTAAPTPTPAPAPAVMPFPQGDAPVPAPTEVFIPPMEPVLPEQPAPAMVAEPSMVPMPDLAAMPAPMPEPAPQPVIKKQPPALHPEAKNTLSELQQQEAPMPPPQGLLWQEPQTPVAEHLAETTPTNIMPTLPALAPVILRLEFLPGSVTLAPSTIVAVRQLAISMQQDAGLKLELHGFGDFARKGSLDASRRMGGARAENVAIALQEFGVDPRRVHVVPIGLDFLPGVARDRVDVIGVR